MIGFIRRACGGALFDIVAGACPASRAQWAGCLGLAALGVGAGLLPAPASQAAADAAEGGAACRRSLACIWNTTDPEGLCRAPVERHVRGLLPGASALRFDHVRWVDQAAALVAFGGGGIAVRGHDGRVADVYVLCHVRLSGQGASVYRVESAGTPFLLE